jgi:hypothetical protein
MAHNRKATFSVTQTAAEAALATVCDASKPHTSTDPAWASIRGIYPEDYAEYISSIKDRAENCHRSGSRPRVWLELDPSAIGIHSEIAQVLEPYQEAYHSWRAETVIKQNFTASELTPRLKIPFDQERNPLPATLVISFEFWGLPEDAFPQLRDIRTDHAPQIKQ